MNPENPSATEAETISSPKKKWPIKKRHFFWLLIILCLFFFFRSCFGKTIHWKQEVQLQDGRVIEVNRISKQTGNIFPENTIIEYEQHIEFINPDSKEKIAWQIPKGLGLDLLDIDKGIAYLAMRPASVADYNTWNCPNPPFIVYWFKDHRWQKIPFEKLPQQFTQPNLMPGAKTKPNMLKDDLITVAEMRLALRQFDETYRTLSRKKIHPIAKGCEPSVLLEQGRESEINVPYYKASGVLVQPNVTE